MAMMGARQSPAWPAPGHGTAHRSAPTCPTATALFDLAGNVWEWTADWFAAARRVFGAGGAAVFLAATRMPCRRSRARRTQGAQHPSASFRWRECTFRREDKPKRRSRNFWHGEFPWAAGVDLLRRRAVSAL
jgi:formylglycine-generating enzyme required for sulfatase activity